MADEPRHPSGVQSAVKRLSGLLTRQASSVTSSLKRRRTSTCSLPNLPNRDVAPSRSALRGGRWPNLEDRRVSFHDSLPHLSLGPSFEGLILSQEEPAFKRRSGLLLPPITTDDRIADDHFREIEYEKMYSDAPYGILRRSDSSAEPICHHRSKTVRFPRADDDDSSQSVKSRRICVDEADAMMEDELLSKKLKRPLPSFANRQPCDRSTYPSVRERPNWSLSQAPNPSHRSKGERKQTPQPERQNDIARTYSAHLDHSLHLTQGQDTPRSSFLRKSLTQMREAFNQTIARSTSPGPGRTGGEYEISYACAHALVDLSRMNEEYDAINHKAKVTSSTHIPDHPSRSFGYTRPHESFMQQNLFATDDEVEVTAGPSARPDGGMVFSSPLTIPPRNPDKRTFLHEDKRRDVKMTDIVRDKDKDALRDSGISL
jgi:hypothetical protein